MKVICLRMSSVKVKLRDGVGKVGLVGLLIWGLFGSAVGDDGESVGVTRLGLYEEGEFVGSVGG